jgi:hypothetical protein
VCEPKQQSLGQFEIKEFNVPGIERAFVIKNLSSLST